MSIAAMQVSRALFSTMAQILPEAELFAEDALVEPRDIAAAGDGSAGTAVLLGSFAIIMSRVKRPRSRARRRSWFFLLLTRRVACGVSSLTVSKSWKAVLQIISFFFHEARRPRAHFHSGEEHQLQLEPPSSLSDSR